MHVIVSNMAARRPPATEPAQGWPAPALSATEATILWALRRMALMQPLGKARCHAVHIALQQDFGDHGMGIEHLLRCWLFGLARFADRPLRFGAPACPLLLPDEALMLRSLAAPDPQALALLIRLAGPDAARLLPLGQALRANIHGETPLSKPFKDIS